VEFVGGDNFRRAIWHIEGNIMSNIVKLIEVIRPERVQKLMILWRNWGGSGNSEEVLDMVIHGLVILHDHNNRPLPGDPLSHLMLR
jgi:hypothetical protein